MLNTLKNPICEPNSLQPLSRSATKTEPYEKPFTKTYIKSPTFPTIVTDIKNENITNFT